MGKDTVEAIDQVKVRAFHASRKMISEIECATSEEFRVMKGAAEKLADTIYHYETKTCDKCLHFRQGGCQNPKSPIQGKVVKPTFGCNEHVKRG